MINRLQKTRNLLKQTGTDALLISSVPNITYLTGFSNFSKDEREAYLLFLPRPTRSPASRPTRSRHKADFETCGYIFTDGRYSEAVCEKVKGFDLHEISSKNPFTSLLLKIIKENKIRQIGFEPQNLSVSEFINFRNKLKPVRLIPTKQLVEQIRVIKEPEEIDKIEDACKIGDKAFDYILGKIKTGITEKELAFELELYIKKQGADIAFPPIVAFGKNSSVPHHQTSYSKLITPSSILLDFGVKLDNYCSDITRTVFFGKATSEQKKIYQTVLDAQKKALEFLSNHYNDTYHHSGKLKNNNLTIEQYNNGIIASETDNIARKYILENRFPTIPHSLGHGIGLEVHESPRLSPKSKDVLKPGMVFSIEPGIYLKGIGGVRIEDLVVLEKSDLKLLTHSSKQLIEC